MILLLDNYDSFTHNLWQLIAVCLPRPAEVLVVRNDACEARDVAAQSPSHVILSPGPGHPRDSGLSLAILDELPETPVLGVCLGHQALAFAAGARVVRSPRPLHGSTVGIRHTDDPLFAGCPAALDVALYHSLVVEDVGLPDTLRVIARTEQGDVMALRHAHRPHVGLQFHPESFMTQLGPLLLRNFLAS